MMIDYIPISVLIPTYNSENVIRNVLESVTWADEIIIVDSYSSDNTVEIAQSYRAKIIQNKYISPAKQKNWAIPFCSHQWILQLDSDEVLEIGLQDEIVQALKYVSADIYAFQIPRKNHVLGVWVKHGGIYPDYQIRLFRAGKVCFDDREVHERIAVTSKQLATLNHHILHYGMPYLSKQVHNLDRYTRYEADEARKQGVSFRWHHLIIRPWLVFFYRYLWQQGFRAGWRGFILCAYLSMYEFLSHAKLWELEELKIERSPQ